MQRGTIQTARFAPDGTIVYAAGWEGRPAELYTTRPEGSLSRALGIAQAQILAISSAGEMAIQRETRGVGIFFGTLARASHAGGVPRDLLQNVIAADWSPDGKNLAVVRWRVEGQTLVEYPIGTPIYRTSTNLISRIRVSPDGDTVAFIEHRGNQSDYAGSIITIDRNGKKHALVANWSQITELAWRNAKELWFGGAPAGAATAIYSIAGGGPPRVVMTIPGVALLQDIDRQGRLLFVRDATRGGVIAAVPEQPGERELGWFDASSVRALSENHQTILFDEYGEFNGTSGVYVRGVYVRGVDGAAAVRLSDGVGMALSPDGKWALTDSMSVPERLVVVPTGAGAPRTLPAGGIDRYSFRTQSRWLKSNEVLFVGAQPGKRFRVWLQKVPDGEPRAITPEGRTGTAMSPDQSRVVVRDREGKLWPYPLPGGDPQAAGTAQQDDKPVGWSNDGEWLYLYDFPSLPAKVYRQHIRTGQRELWKQFMPADPAGVAEIQDLILSTDGRAYAYTYVRMLSDLFLAANF
ncbi:MAG: hypothetical protein DMG57_32145 [Acidobacteria bacterium]|nr:MAG: hypothetical protein DMG57_32145 [Acidobacteriota bacterium]